MPAPRNLSKRSPKGVVVARPLGIELAIHPSWLATFALLAVLTRQELAPGLAPRAGTLLLWGIGIALALGFAVSVVVHEMAHAIVARAYGLEARRITLFLFGGVAQIGKQAPGPAAEFRVALAGPLASLVIAGALAAIARTLHAVPFGGPSSIEQALPGAVGFFAGVNLAVALFNLVPGFPLDGGRILRSGLWMLTRDRARATRWAAWGGRIVALGLVAAGLLGFARGAGGADGEMLAGMWYVMLGWFLFGAVGAAAEAEGGADPSDDPGPTAPSRAPATAARVERDEGPPSEPDSARRGRRARASA